MVIFFVACIKENFKFVCLYACEVYYIINKFAQSNLRRVPRRGAVAHVHRKVPIGYNGVPQIRPQRHPFPWTDPQTQLPAASLDPSDLWYQTASGSNPPFFHNALDGPTDARTYGPTDRPRESLMTKTLCYESDGLKAAVITAVTFPSLH